MTKLTSGMSNVTIKNDVTKPTDVIDLPPPPSDLLDDLPPPPQNFPDPPTPTVASIPPPPPPPVAVAPKVKKNTCS